jgi:hypothetical protein
LRPSILQCKMAHKRRRESRALDRHIGYPGFQPLDQYPVDELWYKLALGIHCDKIIIKYQLAYVGTEGQKNLDINISESYVFVILA